MLCPEELRRMADLLRSTARETADEDAAQELLFLVEEYEAQAKRVEEARLPCDPTIKVMTPK